MRDDLFDLAVNRAAVYAARLGAIPSGSGNPSGGAIDLTALRQVLEPWYLKTRFAYRVPLEQVVAAVARRPGPDWHWQGGPSGGWRPGKAHRP